jgi:hypothetical protein
MKDISKLFFMALILITVVLTAAIERPELAGDLGLEIWNCDTLAACLFSGPPEPDAVQLLAQRSQAKHRVVRDLIANRTTLFEAAAAFRRLDEGNGPSQKLLPMECAYSEEEYSCRQVINWVAAALEREPASVAEEIIRRLENQLSQQTERRAKATRPETKNSPSAIFLGPGADGLRSIPDLAAHIEGDGAPPF